MEQMEMNAGHAVEFLERAYALQQIIDAILDTHPMATHDDAIKGALAALMEAAANLYLAAGNALVKLEETQNGDA